MVDTVGIKVLCHLAEAAYPPLAAILQHLVPVVCRKAPVLAVGREWIGWCTSLTVQVEVLRFYPCLDTVATDTDRDVALEDDTVHASILMSRMHLTVEVELYVAPEVLLAVSLWLLVFGFLGPFGEDGSAILVAIDAELSVGHQPFLVVLVELLVSLRGLDALPFLFEQHLQILHFSAEHTFIVNLWKRIQFLAQLLEVCFLFFIFNFR